MIAITDNSNYNDMVAVIKITEVMTQGIIIINYDNNKR